MLSRDVNKANRLEARSSTTMKVKCDEIKGIKKIVHLPPVLSVQVCSQLQLPPQSYKWYALCLQGSYRGLLGFTG